MDNGVLAAEILAKTARRAKNKRSGRCWRSRGDGDEEERGVGGGYLGAPVAQLNSRLSKIS